MSLPRSFVLACDGKTKSQGGMNLSEMRTMIRKIHPSSKSKIQNLSRRELERFCKKNRTISKSIRDSESIRFLSNIPLDDRQRKYCRCVIKVAAKNDEWCYKHNAWKKQPSTSKSQGRKCYNPYAVCTKSTRRSGPSFRCLENIDLDSLSHKELKSLAMMKGKSVRELKTKVKRERR